MPYSAISRAFSEVEPRETPDLLNAINVHSLRHTFASWAVQRGMDLYRLKESMGHADMKTTLVYAHRRPEALKHEMERCWWRRKWSVTNFGGKSHG